MSGAPEVATRGVDRLPLSVALCTHNGANYLDEQLRSILQQKRLPDEVVICDDRSTDQTIDLVRRFEAKADFPVRIYVNDRTLGPTKNFEKAIQLCEGNLIVLSDQDDCWYESRLSMIEEFFLGNPSAGLVFSDADLMGEKSQLLGKRLWETFGLSEERSRQIQEGRGLDVLLRHNVVSGATMAFRSELRNIVLPIPQITTHDLWISVILSVVSEIRVLPTPLIKYRKHPAQQVGVLYYDFRESIAKAKNVGSAEYLSLASQYAMARDRIQQHRSGRELQKQIDLIEGKIQHMNVRSALPNARWKRIPMILRRTVNGDYFRYSEGIKSIVKDIMR